MRRRIRSAAFPVHRHSIPQLLVDGLLVALAYFLAFRLRFEGAGPTRYEHLFNSTVWWVVPVSMVVLALFGLYERLWTFVGQRDYEAVVKGVIVATVVVSGAIALLHPVQTSSRGLSSPVTLPASVIAMFFLLMLVLLLGARFFVHLIVEGRIRSFRVQKGARDVLIVGGGDGGRLVVRELARNPQLRMRPVGFIDDDPRKQGIKDEHGLKVLGTTSTDDLARILDEVEPDEVVIAIPSAPGTLRARVVAACRKRGIPVRTMPTVFELLADGSGQLKVTRQLREVRVEDMLGREPVRMELERVGAYLANEVVHGDRRRRVDRQRAVPPDRAREPQAAGARRPRRGQPVRDPARARGGPPRAHRGSGARRLQGGGADAGGAHRAPAGRRLPRRRLQARDDDGAQPGRGDPQQRARHTPGRPDRRRDRRRRRSCSSRPTRPSSPRP